MKHGLLIVRKGSPLRISEMKANSWRLTVYKALQPVYGHVWKCYYLYEHQSCTLQSPISTFLQAFGQVDFR